MLQILLQTADADFTLDINEPEQVESQFSGLYCGIKRPSAPQITCSSDFQDVRALKLEYGTLNAATREELISRFRTIAETYGPILEES